MINYILYSPRLYSIYMIIDVEKLQFLLCSNYISAHWRGTTEQDGVLASPGK